MKSFNRCPLLCSLDISDNSNIFLGSEDRATCVYVNYISRDLNDYPHKDECLSSKELIMVKISDIRGLDDNFNYTDEQRIKNIQKFFADKYLSVIIQKKFENGDSKARYFGTNIRVMRFNENVEDKYSPCLLFNENSIKDVKTLNDFISRLKYQNELCNLTDYWSDGKNPDAIIWIEDNKCYIFTGIKSSNNSERGIKLDMSSYAYETKSSDWLNRWYRMNKVVFIGEKIISSIDDKVMSTPDDYLEDNLDLYQHKNVNNDISVSVSEQVVQQDHIFNDFNHCIIDKYGLTYNQADLANFHNSVKTNMLTILTGISGTGKSKIVTAYADSLGIKDEEHFNMVSVRPFWQDDSDVLGFVDSMTNSYHPGDSGLVDTLLRASQNPNDFYIVVFDEMNLARVEYYFSQFLSVLEKNEEDRYLNLYDESVEARLYNGDKYKSKIKIGNNIRFVGTMNIDETTFQISDKVLDRANVIKLRSIKFTERNNVIPDSSITFEEKSYVTYSKYFHDLDKKFNKERLLLFDNINECIQNAIPTTGLGWRTINNIERFVSNSSYYGYPSFNSDIALDYQIAQRILPKIRGTETMLTDLLGDTENDKSLLHAISKTEDISKFNLTIQSISKKRKELTVMGYAN